MYPAHTAALSSDLASAPCALSLSWSLAHLRCLTPKMQKSLSQSSSVLNLSCRQETRVCTQRAAEQRLGCMYRGGQLAKLFLIRLHFHLMCFLFALFWGHTLQCSELPSDSVLRSHSPIWGARDQTQVGCMQSKRLTSVPPFWTEANVIFILFLLVQPESCNIFSHSKLRSMIPRVSGC